MYAVNSAAAITARALAASVRPYSYIATMPADHGRSSGRSASGTPSSSAITATGSGSA